MGTVVSKCNSSVVGTKGMWSWHARLSTLSTNTWSSTSGNQPANKLWDLCEALLSHQKHPLAQLQCCMLFITNLILWTLHFFFYT